LRQHPEPVEGLHQHPELDEAEPIEGLRQRPDLPPKKWTRK
jgi:hypothetical protein